MSIRLQKTALLACALMVFIGTNSAFAQPVRGDHTFYIYPKGGITQYIGDYDPDGSSLWDSDDDGFPWAAGVELGYQFSPSFSLGGEGTYGNYPTANFDLEENDVQTYMGKLIGRYYPMAKTARFIPFLEAGLFGATGLEGKIKDNPTSPLTPDQVNQSDTGFGFGPLFGLGFDVAATDQLSILLELQFMLSIPDDGFDGNDLSLDVDNANMNGDLVSSYPFTPGDDGGAFQRFDLLNQLTLGFKFNFRKPIVPVMISDVNCPTNLRVGDTATFTASVNGDATGPVDYRWSSNGDVIGSGMVATHSFTQPGSYTVNFEASNRGGMVERSCIVNVAPALIGAEIVTLGADRSSFQVCEPVVVQFNAQTRGTEPVTYRWNFGDGTTGTGPNPTHSYTDPGTYTVRLDLSNEVGAVNRTVTINALECESICDDVTELNSSYFPRNASTLTAEGRAALAENLEILRECAELCVRVEGWAAPGERNPQALSTDRARAVAQYYMDNGVAASRVVSMGMGRVGGTTSKKEGGAQFQRTDSIPVPCENLNQ